MFPEIRPVVLKKPDSGLRLYITVVFTLALTLSLFEPSVNSGFLKLDDDEYIRHNYVIQSGLSIESLKWAFTSFYASNWHPVTWLSHMLDIEFFGLNPSLHHRVSFVIHGLNTVLIFLLFIRLTNRLLPGAVIAALFGIHPLHTEAVIWLSERKEILSTMFGLLSLLSYTKYSSTMRRVPYLFSLLFFTLSLLSKPTLVTLPFLLLLLDFWPLNRLPGKRDLAGFQAARRVLKEKIPFLVLTICSCIITIKAQYHGGAIQSFRFFPLTERVENAIYSYMRYGLHSLFPFNLSIIYPHPGSAISAYKLGTSLLCLVTFTLYALRRVRAAPWILTGWLWFAGTLVPVIGIVQVGGQAMSDRYTYFPLTGLFIIFSFWISDSDLPKKAAGFLIIALIYINALHQVSLWKSGVTLFKHALRAGGSTPVAHHLLGLGYAEQEKFQLAMDEYKKSLALYPANKRVLNNLGIALLETGRRDEAIKMFKKALEISPDYEYSRYHLGYAYFENKEYKKAIAELNRAVSINPLYEKAYFYLGMSLSAAGRSVKAAEAFKKSAELSPRATDSLIELGILYSKQGEPEKAVSFFSKALDQDGDNQTALFNLGTIYAKEKKYDNAKYFLETLLALKSDADASFNLGAILLEEKDYAGAVARFAEVLKLHPGDASARERYEHAVRMLKDE